MPLVKGPNGAVFDLPEAIASGLVGSHDGGYEYVSDAPEEVKPDAASKRRATGGASRAAGRKPRGGGSSAGDGGS
ncbi:hypothetical protein GCM10010187_24780 [Actinomadura coerulea]|nr:hypothetical protein GCM10010187_24780 [Actinomadura coerulea]